MAKVDKQAIGVYIVIGIVLFGLITYIILHFFVKSSPSEAVNQSVNPSFNQEEVSGTSSANDEYVSSLDSYEKELESDEDGLKSLNPNLTFDELKPTIKTDSLIKPIPNETAPLATSTNFPRPEQIRQRSYSEPRQTQEKAKDTVIKSKKRGIITATQEGSITSNTDDDIAVLVHGNHDLVDNSTINLRLVKEATINGYTLPAGSVVQGTTYFSSEKADIIVESIEIKGRTIPTNLVLYNKGKRGILARTTTNQEIASDVAKQASSGGFRFTLPVIGGSIQTSGMAGKKIDESKKKLSVPSLYPFHLKAEAIK